VKSYQVALTFADEQRPLVSAVAEKLAADLGRDQVFYDRYHEAEVARPDLDVYLQEIYRDRSRLVVVFLGADYGRKEWCGLEWRAIRDLIKKKASEQIMLVRVDDGEVPGILGIDGYLDARGRTPADIAARILERVDLQRSSPPRTPSHTAPPAKRDAPTRWAEIAPDAVLSLGSFLASWILVALLLWRADLLARLGLTGKFYYLVLLPLGLAVAGFLFGALRSLARYTGRHLDGVLEVGGPVAGFALVVLGGFLLPPVDPSAAVFALTGCPSYGQGFAIGFSTMLSSALEAGGGLRIIDRQRVFEAERDPVLAERLDHFRRNLDADLLISGSCGEAIHGNNSVTVHLEVASTSTPLHFVTQAPGSSEVPLTLAIQLANEIRTRLSLSRISPGQELALERELPGKQEAIHRYFDGIAKFELLQLDAAREDLEEARGYEPHPQILGSLARVLEDLGRSDAAKATIKEAAEHGAVLSQRRQLEIAALRREIEDNWEAAAGNYEELLRRYPRDLQYGLAMAKAQESTGPPARAQATLDLLRKDFRSPASRARIDIRRADLLHDQGRYRAARSAAEQAEQEAGAASSTFLRARAEFLLAQIDSSVGRHAEALAALPRICEVFEQTPGSDFASTCREEVAVESFHLGKPRGLLDLFNEYQAKSDRAGQGRLLHLQSAVAVDHGDYASAERLSDRALKVFRALGDAGREQVVDILAERALLFYGWGKPAEANRYVEEATEGYQLSAQTSPTATVFETLAEIEYYRGNMTTAKDRQATAFHVQCSEQNQEGASYDEFRLGMIYGMEGDPIARTYLEAGIAGLEQPAYKAEAILGLALFELLDGRPESALKLTSDAERLLPDPGASLAVRVRLLRSWAFLALGKVAEASGAYDTVRTAVLTNQDFRVCYESKIFAARLAAASGRPQDVAQAISALAQSAARAQETDHFLLSLEARLVGAEIALRAGARTQEVGRRELQEVAHAAAAKKLTRIAQHAERLLGGSAPPAAPSSTPPPPRCGS